MNLWLSAGLAGLFLLAWVHQLEKQSPILARKILRGGLLVLGLLIMATSWVRGVQPDCLSNLSLGNLDGWFSLLQLFAGTFVIAQLLHSCRFVQVQRGRSEKIQDSENPVRPLPVYLVESSQAGPALWMCRRSLILFPKKMWTQLSNPAKRLVLFHEQGHAQSQDPHWRMWVTMIWALSLFHPVLWLLRRKLYRLDEFIADDYALEKTGERPETLVRLFLQMHDLRSANAGQAAFQGDRLIRADRLLKSQR